MMQTELTSKTSPPSHSIEPETWSQWEDLDENATGAPHSVEELSMPNASSDGLKPSMARISSCYFSIAAGSEVASNSSMNDLLSLLDEHSVVGSNAQHTPESDQLSNDQSSTDTCRDPLHEILYHDVMMNVLEFLDVEDLAAFSETTKSSNYESFYFIQQQLQRVTMGESSSLANLGSLHRLTRMDPVRAERIVMKDYLESNSTLRHPPLSLTMLRKWIRNHVKYQPHRSALAARAALLVTVLGGAASLMTEHSVDPTELYQIMLRLGVVGSLGAAATMVSERSDMRERAQALALKFQGLSSAMMDAAFKAARGSDERSSEAKQAPPAPKNSPSGCVGALQKTVCSTRYAVTQLIADQRAATFQSFPETIQQHLIAALIDTCTSNDSLDRVQFLVRERCVPVDAFGPAADGSQTCAIHASAFHGSVDTLEFLCRGVSQDGSNDDGGLANVNVRDANGWTALHFAAGANHVNVVRVLRRYGAVESEASNGYTPTQWAVRLQNEQVATELQAGSQPWDVRQPFSDLATRFFAMIPTH